MIDARFFVTLLKGDEDNKVIPVSLFKGYTAEEIAIDSRLKKRPLTVTRDKKNIVVKFYCSGCSSYQSYNFSLKSITRNGGHHVFCQDCGLELGFLGSERDVKKIVEKHRYDIEALIKEMGLDDYFNNPLVVYELINYIHDMAENKKIRCECGSFDINAGLSSDKIELTCKKCGSSRFLDARNHEDLEQIKNLKLIIIDSNRTSALSNIDDITYKWYNN